VIRYDAWFYTIDHTYHQLNSILVPVVSPPG
jgi:hypothetical protein